MRLIPFPALRRPTLASLYPDRMASFLLGMEQITGGRVWKASTSWWMEAPFVCGWQGGRLRGQRGEEANYKTTNMRAGSEDTNGDEEGAREGKVEGDAALPLCNAI